MKQPTNEQVPVSLPAPSRRTFLKRAGALGLAAGAAGVLRPSLAAEAVSSAAHPAGSPYAEHMDISVAFVNAADDIKAGTNDAVLNYIEQKFNITIKPVEETWSKVAGPMRP